MSIDFTLPPYGGDLDALAVHPTLPILISSSSEIRVWDLESRTCLRTLAGHTDEYPVCGLAIDPAGLRVATGSTDNTVKIWDLMSGDCVRTLEDHAMSHVFAVAWDPTSRYVASGSLDGAVRVWDATSGALCRQFARHRGDVNALVSHLVENRLASASDDNTVRIWDWHSGERLHVLEGHTASVMSLATSGSRLASGSNDKTVRVWSWDSGECLRVLGFARELYINSLAWRGSTFVMIECFGHYLVGGGRVHVWNTSEEDWTRAEKPPAGTSCSMGVAILEDGRVACAAPDNSARIAVIAP